MSNPLFCSQCGNPAIPDAVRRVGICPQCDKTPIGAMPELFDEGNVRDLLIAHALKDGSAKAAAHKLGISPQYMGDIINGRRSPSANLARKLGLRQWTVYVIE